MGVIVDMASAHQQRAKRIAAEIADLLNRSNQLMLSVRSLPTVQQREQAVIQSSELKMKAHSIAAQLNIRITEENGEYVFTRVEGNG